MFASRAQVHGTNYKVRYNMCRRKAMCALLMLFNAFGKEKENMGAFDQPADSVATDNNDKHQQATAHHSSSKRNSVKPNTKLK